MKIGILGTGDVGKSLGNGFLKYGHEVMMGSRMPESPKVRDWLKQAGESAWAGTFEETAEFGELLVLAIDWNGCKNAIDLADPVNFRDKIVMDITNPLVYQEEGPPKLALGHTDSGGEQIQRWLPGAKVVKVFNTVGHDHMVDPDFPKGPPDMFICGNDSGAKKKVNEICNDFGWPTVDIGGIEGARELEPLCILWVKYGFIAGTWDHAFKLLRK